MERENYSVDHGTTVEMENVREKEKDDLHK